MKKIFLILLCIIISFANFSVITAYAESDLKPIYADNINDGETALRWIQTRQCSKLWIADLLCQVEKCQHL